MGVDKRTIVYTLSAGLVISHLMKKLGLKKCRGMEFDAAGVERISGCHVSDTMENTCLAS